MEEESLSTGAGFPLLLLPIHTGGWAGVIIRHTKEMLGLEALLPRGSNPKE